MTDKTMLDILSKFADASDESKPLTEGKKASSSDTEMANILGKLQQLNEGAESKSKSIKERIRELEAELETLEPGDYSYDVVNSELESLYSQLNESAEPVAEAHGKVGEKCSCCGNTIKKDGTCGCDEDCPHCGGKPAKVKEEEMDEARAKKAVAGGKVQKLVTGFGMSYKGKKYDEIDLELVSIDNSSQIVTFRILHPREHIGDEVKIPFKTLRMGRFMATDTSKINKEEEMDEASCSSKRGKSAMKEAIEQIEDKLLKEYAEFKEMQAHQGVAGADAVGLGSANKALKKAAMANHMKAAQIGQIKKVLAKGMPNKQLEEEPNEGNEFSGELAKAKAAGADTFKVGDKEYKVKEDFDKGTPVGTKKKTKHGTLEKTATGVKHTRDYKPDYLDLDGDGDKEEPMKKAAKDKKEKKA